MTLAYLGLSWLAGVALAGWLQPPLAALGMLALPALAAVGLWWRERGPRWVAVYCLVLLAGGARAVSATASFDPGNLAIYNERGRVIVTGVVDAPPNVGDTYQKLLVRAETIGAASAPSAATSAISGLVLVYAPLYPAYSAGDRLALTGSLQAPDRYADPGYQEFLVRRGIHSMMWRPAVRLLERGQVGWLESILAGIRAQVGVTLQRIVHEPYAGLLSGVLLGTQGGIPKALYQQFRATGSVHILVVSGFNIAIVCSVLMALGTRLVGKRAAGLLALAGVVLYTLLVGADPPVMRAAIMGGLTVIALRLGRPGEARNALLLAAWGMTAYYPGYLWDVSFQLSFAATAGLIWLAVPLEGLTLQWLAALLGAPMASWARALVADGLVVTLAAQLSTLPLILHHFGQLSLVSLLTNLLILPVQPAIMALGGLAVTLGLIWLPAGQLVGWLAWLPLAWTTRVVEWTATWFTPAVDVERLPFWGLMLAYAGLAVLGWALHRTRGSTGARPALITHSGLRTSTRAMLLIASTCIVVAWLAWTALPDGRLHVVFLDVGQGDAILITTPRGQHILIDGGPSPNILLSQLSRHLPFWDRSLEIVVNTHPEADHVTGLVAAAERYRIARAVLSDVDHRSGALAALRAALAEAEVEVSQASAGMQLKTEEGLVLEILHPGRVPAGERPNDHSVVIWLRWGQVSFLLPGDIPAEIEDRLVGAYPHLKATVLKAAHHGSAGSSSAPWLNTISPQVVVISVAADNPFNLPAPETLGRYSERGIQVLRTDQSGSIECITDGERLWVRGERSSTIE